MSFFDKSIIYIYGIEHFHYKNKDVEYYAIFDKKQGKEVFHRADGEPALISSMGKREFYVFGQITTEERAKNQAMEFHKNFVQLNIKSF